MLKSDFCSEFSFVKTTVPLLSHLLSHFPVSVAECVTNYSREESSQGTIITDDHHRRGPSSQGSITQGTIIIAGNLRHQELEVAGMLPLKSGIREQ